MRVQGMGAGLGVRESMICHSKVSVPRLGILKAVRIRRMLESGDLNFSRVTLEAELRRVGVRPRSRGGRASRAGADDLNEA